MAQRFPLWTTHFESGDVRIIETHGKTFRVLVAGGHMEIGYELAERIARELLRALRTKKPIAAAPLNKTPSP